MDITLQPCMCPNKVVKIVRFWVMVLALGWLIASIVDIRAFWIQKNAVCPTEADGWAVWNLGLTHGILFAIPEDSPSYFEDNQILSWHPPDSAALLGFFRIDADCNWGAMAIGLVYPLVFLGLVLRKISNSWSLFFKTILVLLAFFSGIIAFMVTEYRVSISCYPMDLKDAPQQCQIFILGDVKVVAVPR